MVVAIGAGDYTITSGATALLPTNAAPGDLLIGFATRLNSNTAPLQPTGWTNVMVPAGGNTASMRVSQRTMVAGDASVTFTNASAVAVLRLAAATGLGDAAQPGGAGNPLTVPALALTDTDGSSMVLIGVAHRDTNTPPDVPGATLVGATGTAASAANSRLAIYATGSVTAWAGSSVTVALAGVNSPAGWRCQGVEVLSATAPGPGAPAADPGAFFAFM
jgi:hypothetical protein